MKTLVYEKLADKHKYIYYYHVDDMKQKKYRFFDNHIHKSIEMVVCYDGVLSYKLNDKAGTIGKGQVLITNSFDRHYYEYVDNASIDILVFSKDLIEDVFENPGYEFNNIISISEEDFPKLLQLTFLFNDLGSMKYIEKKANIFNIFSLLSRYNLFKRAEESKEKNTVLQIIDYMEKHYNEDISLSSISKDLGYSTNYFSHLFNKVIGTNFSAHLNSIRMEKVLELKNSKEYKDKPLSEIITLCGFNSKETYYRALRKHDL